MSDLVRLSDGVFRIICKRCHEVFEIGHHEQAFYTALAQQAAETDGRSWYLPRTCQRCRAAQYETAARVAGDADDEWVVCLHCGVTFRFGGRDREYWARQNWPRPKRCRACRTARRPGEDATS